MRALSNEVVTVAGACLADPAAGALRGWGSASWARSAQCAVADPPALPSFQAGLWSRQPSSELAEGAGAAHAHERVSPKATASFALAAGAPTAVMRLVRSPPGQGGGVRQRCQRPRGCGAQTRPDRPAP
jgi:hypothetical protein